MNLGKLIVVEGPEGGGKGTAVEGLRKHFTSLGFSVVTSREPGGVPVAEKIRNIVRHDEMHPITEAYLFMAARAEHVQKVIKPSLKEGKIVILDRFYHTSLTMQGYARGLDVHELRRVHHLPLDGVYVDYAFFLDVPPTVGLARKADQGGDEVAKFEKESMDFQEAVYHGYKELTKRNELIRIDALQEPNKVLADIINYIKL